MPSWRHCYLLLLALTAAGCTTLRPPAASDHATPPASSAPPVERDEQIAPVDTAPAAGVALAVAQLLERGWFQLGRGEWRAALSLAERAQRLDRFQPESYLLIASAHYRLAQHALAVNIALQGRSYAAAGTEAAIRLDALLALLDGAQN